MSGSAGQFTFRNINGRTVVSSKVTAVKKNSLSGATAHAHEVGQHHTYVLGHGDSEVDSVFAWVHSRYDNGSFITLISNLQSIPEVIRRTLYQWKCHVLCAEN